MGKRYDRSSLFCGPFNLLSSYLVLHRAPSKQTTQIHLPVVTLGEKGYNISLACNSPGRQWCKVMGWGANTGLPSIRGVLNPTPDHPICIPPQRMLGDAGKKLLDNDKPSSVEPFSQTSKHLAVLEQCPLAPILSC